MDLSTVDIILDYGVAYIKVLKNLIWITILIIYRKEKIII